MITLTALAQRFSLQPSLVSFIRTHQGRIDPREVEFTREQAARVVMISEFQRYWPSLSRFDLVSLYNKAEGAFKRPPTMTYEFILSPRLKIQIIPKQYLMQVEIVFPDEPA